MFDNDNMTVSCDSHYDRTNDSKKPCYSLSFSCLKSTRQIPIKKPYKGFFLVCRVIVIEKINRKTSQPTERLFNAYRFLRKGKWMFNKSKEPDVNYVKSAVNLANNPLHLPDLEILDVATKKLAAKMAELAAMGIAKEIAQLEADVAMAKEAVKRNIQQYGSYQDAHMGYYAIQQRRVKLVYSPDLLRQYIPDFAEEAIKEVVDNDVLNALKKDKLIPAPLISKCACGAEESFVFITRANSNFSLPREEDDLSEETEWS